MNSYMKTHSFNGFAADEIRQIVFWRFLPVDSRPIGLSDRPVIRKKVRYFVVENSNSIGTARCNRRAKFHPGRTASFHRSPTYIIRLKRDDATIFSGRDLD